MLGLDGHWYAVLDTDPRAQALYKRHYSVKNRRSWWPMGFVPAGDDMVLLTLNCAALFVWKAHRDQDVQLVHRKGYDDGQRGINCMIFRNEGAGLSSELIREADDLAWQRWPGERHFTYVADAKVQSSNPGYCFLKAGWQRCGRNADGRLTILERLP